MPKTLKISFVYRAITFAKLSQFLTSDFKVFMWQTDTPTDTRSKTTLLGWCAG